MALFSTVAQKQLGDLCLPRTPWKPALATKCPLCLLLPLLLCVLPAVVGKEPGAAARRAETDQVVVDPLPHPDQVLYAVAFSPNYRGLAMLAAGGGAGLVRLHPVSAEVVPVGW